MLGFWLSWDLSLLSSFLFLPFEIKMSSLYQSHHCILEVHDLPGFTSSQLERNCASEWIISKVSPILDLDSILDLDLKLMLECFWTFCGCWFGVNVFFMWEGREFGWGQRKECYDMNCVSLRFVCGRPNLLFDSGNKAFRKVVNVKWGHKGGGPNQTEAMSS